MHPLALGAFCLAPQEDGVVGGAPGLNAPFGARCFLSGLGMENAGYEVNQS